MMNAEKITELRKFACDIRIKCMEQFGALGIGHVGGSLSCCDLMACLYGGIMNINPKEPKWEERDRFIMSKGHAGPAMYAALALRGYFEEEKLLTLNRPGTMLPSHTDSNRTPGVDMTTGSLGQGFSTGLGIALACRLKKLDNYIYILLGDGECDEGQVWECAMFAPAKKLTNVIVFVDANKLQLDGATDEVCALLDLRKKFEDFGWQAIETGDGNDAAQIVRAVEEAKADTEHPSVIILNTVKGKGWSYAETHFNHNMPVTPEQAQEAIAEIRAAKAAL